MLFLVSLGYSNSSLNIDLDNLFGVFPPYGQLLKEGKTENRQIVREEHTNQTVFLFWVLNRQLWDIPDPQVALWADSSFSMVLGVPLSLRTSGWAGGVGASVIHSPFNSQPTLSSPANLKQIFRKKI